jgi:hypothetical protein
MNDFNSHPMSEVLGLSNALPNIVLSGNRIGTVTKNGAGPMGPQ